ncbi:STX5 isoform 7, partial [Pan troglodytes]
VFGRVSAASVLGEEAVTAGEIGSGGGGRRQRGVTLVPPPPDTMSCRDRTQEFLSACKSLQTRQAGV